jgi:hypothetical protein
VLSFPKIISGRIGDAAYTDQPSGMQVVVYLITLLVIFSLTRLVVAQNSERPRKAGDFRATAIPLWA